LSTAATVIEQLPAAEYHAMPGLSSSGMRDLEVSTLRYWFNHVRPDREEPEETPFMQFGSALHCAVLESTETFRARYACELDMDDFSGALVTMEDLRGWIKDKGHAPKGTKKADVIAQVQAIDPHWPILDVLVSDHERLNAGKTIFKVDDWDRLAGCARSLLNEPRILEILKDGRSEVSLTREDPETGVLLKGRLDWMHPKCTLDVKTFSQKNGKTIDQSVNSAITYEKYYRAAVNYATLRGWPHEWPGEHVLAFVESEEPFETRLKALRPKTGGQPNLYWQRGLLESRNLTRLYANCVEQYGTKPWRSAQDIDPVIDDELPGMSY
jgi:hypothetical protein